MPGDAENTTITVLICEVCEAPGAFPMFPTRPDLAMCAACFEAAFARIGCNGSERDE